MTAAQPVVDVRSGELAASKTHKSRAWYFTPCGDSASAVLGVLTVKQGKEAVSYDVGREAGEVYFARKHGEPECYAVQLAAGKPIGCSCTGWRFKRMCKHVDAVRAMQADGIV